MRHVHIEELDTTGPQPYDFSTASFRGGRFRQSRFRGASFRRADWTNADLQAIEFDDCSLEYATISGSFLDKVDVKCCSARDSEWIDSKFLACRFRENDLEAANIHDNVFEHCSFESVKLARASVTNNHFFGCTFVDCDLADQTLAHSVFSDCTFQNVKLAIDALVHSTGLHLDALSGVTVVDGENVVPHRELPEKLLQLFREFAESNELSVAATLAVLLRRPDLLASALKMIPSALRQGSAEAGSAEWLRLGRRLLHWTSEGFVDPYWLAFLFRSLKDRVEEMRLSGSVPPFHLLETMALLAGPVQSLQADLARAVIAEGPSTRLAEPVRVTLTTTSFELEAALRLVGEVFADAALQLPPALPPLEFRYSRHRTGSLIIDGETIVLGALLLKFVISQARDLTVQSLRAAQEIRSTYNEFSKKALGGRVSSVDPTRPLETSVVTLPSEQHMTLTAMAGEHTLAVGLLARVVVHPAHRESLQAAAFSVTVEK